jgi:hypothetical protein
MSGLDDLTLNRRNIKNAIRRLQNSISGAETDVNVLETSLVSISDLFKEYDAVQFKIEKLQLKKKDADQAQLAEESDKVRGEVETQYRAIVSKIKSLLRKNKSSASDSINIKAPIIQGRESLDCINLKHLPLPTFTGKYGEWFTNFHHCRAVLDQCSKVSLITITESMCKKLNLRTYSSNACITGVNVSENIAHRPFHLKSQRLSYLPILF